ncbi:hypothetical protein [Aquaticitalea lipolytica]|nr:hypothetical protein [Aquaticitalea lipolytica]
MKKLIFILSCVLVFSCKNDSKQTNSNDNKAEQSTKMLKDNEIENALYNGTFIKNSNGYDVVAYNNSLYLLKPNPNIEDKTNHFFLELKSTQDNPPTIDINPTDFIFNDSLSENFNNVAVYKYPLLNKNDTYDILIGQFNDEGRVWSSYMSNQSFKNGVKNYKNEYLNNLKTNRFLLEFESALNQGYFIKHDDNFDLLIDDNIIYYIKPNGDQSDLETQFYLHITYLNNPEKLITDFNAKDYQINQVLGVKYKNFIVVKKEIPNTEKIIEVGTGQFNSSGRTWGVLYNIEKMYDNISYIYDNHYKDYIKD